MSCPICYTQLDTHNRFTFLCFHKICNTCFKQWNQTCLQNKIKTSCPLCRKNKEKNQPTLLKNLFYTRFSSYIDYRDSDEELT